MLADLSSTHRHQGVKNSCVASGGAPTPELHTANPVALTYTRVRPGMAAIAAASNVSSVIEKLKTTVDAGPWSRKYSVDEPALSTLSEWMCPVLMHAACTGEFNATAATTALSTEKVLFMAIS
jgi:hypothetical protein